MSNAPSVNPPTSSTGKAKLLRLRRPANQNKPINEWFGACACGKNSFVTVLDWPENPYPCYECYKKLVARRAEIRHQQ